MDWASCASEIPLGWNNPLRFCDANYLHAAVKGLVLWADDNAFMELTLREDFDESHVLWNDVKVGLTGFS